MIIKLNHFYVDNIGTMAHIVGEVQPDTVDYEEGYRFFDHEGLMFKETGSIGWRNPTPMDLVYEATPSQINNFTNLKRRYVLDEITDVDGYVKVDDPKFDLHACGVYINRMGLVAYSGDHQYDRLGRVYPDGTSMYDILFQVVQ
jgi:hypothetical protein